MDCPNCQTANPEGAKFCFNCGTSLPIACQNCGTKLVAGARFCSNCGHPVAGSVPAPPPDSTLATQRSEVAVAQPSVHKYIPGELLSKLQVARASRSMVGERRIVTVLFCDVKGSTSMAETLDPEEWLEIMNGAFEHLIKPIYRYEGTLARLIGDAILAFFGAPIAHEDDPQRAVLAGLEIIQAIQGYHQQVKRRYGLDLNVRVGINTGLVVVGEIGSDLHVEYSAMGDAVNLAARMEQTAEPGTVQVSGNTYKSIANLFEFQPLGDIQVKGRSEPVLAYRVLKPREGAVPTRGIEGLNSPLVGREREMETLQSRVEELLSGRGQVVSLVGEAGLGKSRLIAELRRTLPQQVQWHEGRSLSYETSTPYAPFIDLFSSVFRLSAEEGDEEKYRKVKAGVEEVTPEQAEAIAPFIAALLGIEPQGRDAELVRFLEPPMLRGRIFYAVGAFFEALASRAPLALMFEDLHWVDPTSIELLEQLLPLTDRAPLMLLALFRPHTQEPSWRFHETASRDYGHRYTQVALQPLDETSSRQLVANLLEIEDLPERVRALILRKAEGNPFFVEEVIRSLLDARLVVREGDHWRATREIENIAVPDTLAGVITARLDRLDNESKQVAQTASVVGREFEYDVLEEVHEAAQALEPTLANLQRRELVREKSRFPERAYLFKHVLTQETAYASVLLSRRRELHRRVAECLERVEPERVNEIARHFTEARENERALPYLIEAGDRAARSGAKEEAAGYYRRAIEIVQTVDNRELARRAYEGLGKTLEFAMDVAGAIEAYQQMMEYAEERGDAAMKVSGINKISYVKAFLMGDVMGASQELDQAEQVAQEEEDIAGLAENYTIRCGICNMTADFGNAAEYLREAAQLARQIDQKEREAYGLAHEALTRTHLTEYEHAWAVAQQAIQVADEAGNLERKGEVLSYAKPFYLLHKGETEEALRSAEEGYRIGARIGALYVPIVGAMVAGFISNLRGEHEQALTWYERGVESARPFAEAVPFMYAMPLGGIAAVCLDISDKLAEKAMEVHAQAREILGTPWGMPAGGMAWTDLGFCALALGNVDLADEFFQNGLTTPSIHMHQMRPRLLVGAAMVALSRNQPEEAARWVAEAHAYAEEREMRHFYPIISLTQGRVSAAQSDMDLALEHFARAEALALEMGMRPTVWQARAGAANALSAKGCHTDAQAKRDQALQVVDEIASLFQNQEYRQMFLESATSKVHALAGA